MDRLARGTLVDIPTPFARPPAVVTVEAPRPKPAPPPPPAPVPARSSAPAASPKQACDLASACPHCGTMMQPEHAHYRCVTCGYRDSCCF